MITKFYFEISEVQGWEKLSYPITVETYNWNDPWWIYTACINDWDNIEHEITTDTNTWYLIPYNATYFKCYNKTSTWTIADTEHNIYFNYTKGILWDLNIENIEQVIESDFKSIDFDILWTAYWILDCKESWPYTYEPLTSLEWWTYIIPPFTSQFHVETESLISQTYYCQLKNAYWDTNVKEINIWSVTLNWCLNPDYFSLSADWSWWTLLNMFDDVYWLLMNAPIIWDVAYINCVINDQLISNIQKPENNIFTWAISINTLDR